MALEFSAAPIRDPIAQLEAETQRLMLPRVWIDWFTSMGIRIEEQSQTLTTVELPNLSGNIPATPIPLDALAAGLYRITYYVRITIAASLTSSLQIGFGWTDGAVPCSILADAITTNSTNSAQSGSIMVKNDQAAPLTYQVVYASNLPGMQYDLSIVVEQMN